MRKELALEDGQIIPLMYDFMFTEVFNSEEMLPILELFIATYLGIDPKLVKNKITILSRELPNSVKIEMRKQVDLLLEYDNKKINIEMNTYKESRERNLIYAFKIGSINVKNGKQYYENLKKVLQINLNAYPDSQNNFISRCFIKDENNKISSDILEIDHICMEKAKESCYNHFNEIEAEIAKWCRLFFVNSIIDFRKGVEGIMSKKMTDMFCEKVESLSKNSEMVYLYAKYDKQTMAYNTAMHNIAKEQGRLAKEQGRLAKEQGRLAKEQDKLEKEQDKLEKEQDKLEKEQDKLEKEKKNLQIEVTRINKEKETINKENSINIAKNMLKLGLEKDIIASSTGLSIDIIDSL